MTSLMLCMDDYAIYTGIDIHSFLQQDILILLQTTKFKMARESFLSLLLFVVCVTLVVGIEAGTKYDRTANRANNMDLSSMGKEFKSRQIVQLWQKAHRMELSKDKLRDLHRDLVRLDAMYYKAKKEGTMRDDNDNHIRKRDDAEMTIDLQIRETMRKYGLGGGPIQNDKMKDVKPKNPDMPFADRKITQLWLKARKSNMFSDEELAELKSELSNHQEKMDDFNNLMDEIHGPDGSKANTAKRFDNKNPDEVRDIRNKEMELKLKHRELQREYQKIAAKTIPEEERGPFTENRVITLWREAKQQGFSEEDLRMIKEELMAFEDKIMEHEDVHKEALQNDMTRRSPPEGGKPDKNKPLKDRSLYDRAKELGKNVNEKMKQLRHKISQGGSWLDEL